MQILFFFVSIPTLGLGLPWFCIAVNTSGMTPLRPATTSDKSAS